MQRMVQEMLLMVLGAMTAVVFNLLAKLEEIDILWSAASVRNAFKNYFVSSQGEVEWQYQCQTYKLIFL